MSELSPLRRKRGMWNEGDEAQYPGKKAFFNLRCSRPKAREAARKGGFAGSARGSPACFSGPDTACSPRRRNAAVQERPPGCLRSGRGPPAAQKNDRGQKEQEEAPAALPEQTGQQLGPLRLVRHSRPGLREG